MNPPRYDRATAAAKQALRRVKGVRSVVLFGSVARGSAQDLSDIDLFIECAEEAEKRVWRVLHDLSREFDVSFSPIFYRPKDRGRFDEQLLESVVRHGRVLHGALPSVTPEQLDLQPLRLVSYETRGLNPRRRARLLRALDGYRTRKRVGGKVYAIQKEGLLAQVGGWRVGRGAVVVPEEGVTMFDDLLRQYGAKRLMVPIWSQRP
ncbi:MAG: nucleotidyltransferase domain-containing protein [Euryarchaeota archaeon]|nr:nucleotidyltransferase domain-containing protein [Euryarchaeota archaeon]